ncbi:hypothetical protein CsSME_00008961 [Camellia sinensis var. sinensis]
MVREGRLLMGKQLLRGRKVSTTECHQPRVKATGLNVKRAAQLGIARGANERKKEMSLRDLQSAKVVDVEETEVEWIGEGTGEGGGEDALDRYTLMEEVEAPNDLEQSVVAQIIVRPTCWKVNHELAASVGDVVALSPCNVGGGVVCFFMHPRLLNLRMPRFPWGYERGGVRITAEYFDSAPFTLKDFKNATLQVEWIKEQISKFADVVESESDAKDEDESPLLTTIRSKCITQLLLLGAIDKTDGYPT